MRKITARDTIGRFDRDRFERIVRSHYNRHFPESDCIVHTLFERNGDGYKNIFVDYAWDVHCDFLEDMRTW